MRVVKSICQMCYFYCGLDVTVDAGRIIGVQGSREHPVNHGRLCAKGLASHQLVSDPRRLRKPLRRNGPRGSGRWTEISWDEALDEMAERLGELRDGSRPERLGYYRGQAPGWVTNYNYVLRFMNAWGSPNVFTHAHLCFIPRAVAHAATFGGFPEPDYERAKSIMLVGYNPATTSPVNYGPRVIRAKQRGARLIVVDPRFTSTASKADIFLQPRPGSTGALLLAMINVVIEEELFDHDFVDQWTVGFEALADHVRACGPEWAETVTGVPAEQIREAARTLARTRPPLVVDGNGLDMQTNAVQTVRATSILRALLKTVDEPGGSILVPHLPMPDVALQQRRPREFDDPALCRYPLYHGFGQTMTGVELTDAASGKAAHPVEALIVQGGDPVASMSGSDTVRESLSNIPFIAVHDIYMTSTARIADLVLPAASFLERDLVLYYRYRPFADGNIIAMQNQCVPPVGESKSDMDFILALARRLGMDEDFPWQNARQALDRQLEPMGFDTDWLSRHPGGYVRRYSPKELYRKYEKNGFNTPSGKIELYSSRLKELGLNPLPEYEEPALSPFSRPDLAERFPLIGSTGLKLAFHTHTQFHSLPWLREMEPDPFAEIHPETARDAGIDDGQWMVVESPRGGIRVRSRVSRSVLPGVVMVSYGYGQPYAGEGELSNSITSEKERDPACGATDNRSFPCRIAPAR